MWSVLIRETASGITSVVRTKTLLSAIGWNANFFHLLEKVGFPPDNLIRNVFQRAYSLSLSVTIVAPVGVYNDLNWVFLRRALLAPPTPVNRRGCPQATAVVRTKGTGEKLQPGPSYSLSPRFCNKWSGTGHQSFWGYQTSLFLGSQPDERIWGWVQFYVFLDRMLTCSNATRVRFIRCVKSASKGIFMIWVRLGFNYLL